MTLVIFLLATAVLLLLTIPFVMMISEVEDLWVNIKLWAVVFVAWLAVWFAVSYGS